MKYLCLPLFLVACKPEMPHRGYYKSQCVEEKLRKTQQCSNSAGGAVGGAVVGGLLLGPIGAAIGLLGGGQGSGHCTLVDEPYCSRYENVWQPNVYHAIWCNENQGNMSHTEAEECAKGSKPPKRTSSEDDS